jgi:hypothetical protein
MGSVPPRRIAEDVDCLLHLRQILAAHDHSGWLDVARHHDTLVLVFHTVDHLGQVVADISK